MMYNGSTAEKDPQCFILLVKLIQLCRSEMGIFNRLVIMKFTLTFSQHQSLFVGQSFHVSLHSFCFFLLK